MKKLILKFRSDSRGAAMAVALLCVGVLSVLGVALWQYFMTDTTAAAQDEKSMQAYYLARSGADAVAKYIMKNPDNKTSTQLDNFIATLSSATSPTPVPFGKGNFSIKVQKNADNSINIYSTGTVSGTVKNITLTLVPIGAPDTPEDAVDASGPIDWLNGSSHVIKQKANANNDKPVKFDPGNGQPVMKVTPNADPNFKSPGIYFENAVAIDNKATLTLNADIVVFRGKVTFNDKQGSDQLYLNTYQNGSGMDGSLVPGGDPNRKYGIVYFVNGAGEGSNIKITGGGYYFPSGCAIPYNGGSQAWKNLGLIPYTGASGYKQIWK